MHAILAETVTGKVDTADLFFLLAMILLGAAALLVALANVATPPTVESPPGEPYRRVVVHDHAPITRWSLFCAYLGLAFIALGLWVL